MKFGSFFILPSATGDHARELSELLEQVDLAEELGYDSLWLAEHHSGYGMIGEPAVLLAALAQRTSRIRLGSGVTVLPFHNPVRVAEDYAMVDQLSHGRLMLGVGRGNQPDEYYKMSADSGHSREVMWESIELIRQLWTGDKVSFHGRHFHFDGLQTVPRPVQSPVPIYVAAVSPNSFIEAGEHGLPVSMALCSIEGYKANAAITRRHLSANGHDSAMEFPLTMNSYFAPSVEEAIADFKGPQLVMHDLFPRNPFSPALTHKDFELYRAGVVHADEVTRDPEQRLRQSLDAGTVIATDPAGAIERLRAYAAAGLEHFVMATAVGGLAHEKVLRSMRLFAEEVAPALRETAAVPHG